MIRKRKRARTGVDKSGLPFAYKPPPGKAERRAGRNHGMLRLRLAVLRRALGKCEFMCTLRGEPTDAHHVLGGADRQALESEYTLAALCEDCHTRCNAQPLWKHERGLVWARRLAAEAKARGDLVAVAGFTFTAELLEGKLALAHAQQGPSRG